MLLMRELIRFQQGLSGNAEQEGDLATAKAILVRALDLPEHLGRRAGNTVNSVALSRLFLGVVVASLLALEEREPGTLTLEEYNRYWDLQSDLRQKEQRSLHDASSLSEPPRAVVWLPLTTAFVLFNPAFAVLTVLIGGGLLLVAVLVRPCDSASATSAAPWKQIVAAWIAGWLASLAVAIVWAVKLRAQRAPPLVVDDYLLREAVVKMGYLLGGAFLWAGKSLERLAILAALLISTVWTVGRYRKRGRSGEVPTTRRGVVFACARDGGRLMVAAAVLLVAVQLLLLPAMIDFTEAQYRYWEQWMSTPGADWRLWDAADGSGGSNRAG